MSRSDGRNVAFVQVKTFSGTNAHIVAAIEARHTVVARVDGYEAINPRRLGLQALLNLGATLAHYGLSARRGSRLLKTPYAFRAMTRFVERQLDRQSASADLIFQVQTLCGVGMHASRVPYVIYTDCTGPMAARMYDAWRVPEGLIALEREVFRAATFVATDTRAARESTISDYGVDPGRVVAVGCGVQLPGVPAADNDRPRRITCLTTDPQRHRVDIVRQAFAEIVRPRYPRVELVLGGPAFADPAAAQPGERFVGPLAYEAFIDLLGETAIYAMPSRAGGSSSVLDAMAMGCACVVVGGNPFMTLPQMVDGETLLVAPQGDVADFGERMVRLLGDPDLARQLGREAAERVRREASWDAVIERVFAALPL